jgi:imidazoleglycerol-phosphate dehydratase / histidinol-phosphatase
MSGACVAFVDRDGTLIEEPADEQVDALEKLRFMPGVFMALADLQRRGFRLVIVTNQDGLGSPGYPRAAYNAVHEFMIDAFASQGVQFDAVFVCPHRLVDACACRKPATALIEGYLREHPIDIAGSWMIGDRDTDLQFARNIGMRGLLVRRHGTPAESWLEIVREVTARRAHIERATRETRIEGSVNLESAAPLVVTTGIGFFDHMLEQLAKHGGFSLELSCRGDLEIDEHHTVEDCALALGAALRRALGSKSGIARYGFLLPMDEARAQVAVDLSGRAFATFSGVFNREKVGGLPTELVPHFFRSLAESLGAAIHVSVTGENSHHMIEACFKGVGRALRQALRCEGEELPTTKGML